MVSTSKKKDVKWFEKNGIILFDSLEIFNDLCMKTNHGLFDEDELWGNDIQSELENYFDFETNEFENNWDESINFIVSEVVKYFTRFENFIKDMGIIVLNVGIIKILDSLSVIIMMSNSYCDNFHILEFSDNKKWEH